MEFKKRIIQLDGLRLFMCLAAVLSHLEFLSDTPIAHFYKTYIQQGGLIVTYFFILSGFGIYYSLYGKEIKCSLKDSIKFALIKIKKIYPVYVISCFIGLIEWLPSSFFGEHNYSVILRLLKVLVSFILCPFLIQSLTGMKKFSHAMNGVCWFLSCLFISYIFCPIFVNITNKCKNRKSAYKLFLLVLLTILLLSAIAAKLDNQLFFGKIDDLYYGHPFIRCLYLLLGMCISKLTILNKERNSGCNKNSGPIFIIYLIYFIFRNVIGVKLESLSFTVEPWRCLDIIITSVLIYSFANGKGRIVNFFASNKIAKYSVYCMYVFLFHYPIRRIIDKIAEHIGFYSLGYWTYILVIIFILALTYFISLKCIQNKEKINKVVYSKVDRILNFFNLD